MRPRVAPVMQKPRRAPAAAVPRQPTGPGPLTLLWRSIRSNVPSFAWHGALALMSTLIMGGLARSFARLNGSGPAWFDIAALLIIFIWVAALILRSIIRSQP